MESIFTDGVGAQLIQEKTGMSQSTISHYLSILQRSDLIITERIGKWTYYRRYDATIRTYLSKLQPKLWPASIFSPPKSNNLDIQINQSVYL